MEQYFFAEEEKPQITAQKKKGQSAGQSAIKFLYVNKVYNEILVLNYEASSVFVETSHFVRACHIIVAIT